MTNLKRRGDRRTQRTRQVLQQAFMDIVRAKGFTATSIQEIAERANVNRGTFYLHFADKYTLTETVVREAFRKELDHALPAAPGWNLPCLQLLIQAVLQCLEGKYRHQPRPLFALAEVAPLVERAMHEELTALLLTWLTHAERAQMHRLVSLEMIARIISWAIFGTATQWSQEATVVAAEEMARTILLVIMEGVAQLVPEMTLA